MIPIERGAASYVVQNLSWLFDLMRFYLVYRGPLSATQAKSKKRAEIKAIREQLQPQLKTLWETHPALIRLRWTARVPDNDTYVMESGDSPLYEHMHRPPGLLASILQAGFVDLTAPIERHGKRFIPLVRKSLDLTCAIHVLFLRQEDPGSLVKQAGDLDNRIKTLFDALEMPSADASPEQVPDGNPVYCLMENDTLVSGFDVDSERLLLPDSAYPNEVHLVMEVTIRVTRVGNWNICLVGG